MRNILLKSFAVVAAGLMLGACEENAIEDHNEPVTSGAFVKFVHAAPAAPELNYYCGSAKISSVPVATDGSVKGLTYSGINYVYPFTYGYANVAAGNANLQALGLDKAVVANSSPTLEEGAYYTAFLLENNGTFENFVIEDEMPEDNYSKAYVRVVNVLNSSGITFDVVLVKKATTETAEERISLADNIASKGNTAYIGFEPKGGYVIEVTVDGETTPLITSSNITFTPGRVHTYVLRGDVTDKILFNLYRDR